MMMRMMNMMKVLLDIYLVFLVNDDQNKEYDESVVGYIPGMSS